MSSLPRVYLVDDEPLALTRLRRMLEATGRVEVVGAETDPEAALAFLAGHEVDAIFLDVEMPGMTGFELVRRLDSQPFVVFATAFDQYALRAFEVSSVDYLLKPIRAEHLDRALSKIERLTGGGPREDLREAIERVAAAFGGGTPAYPSRVASRLGDRVQFVDLDRVTHFFARDKLTYAATAEKDYVVDQTIAELEARLDPRRFLRVHRSVLVNADAVQEVRTRFAGRVTVRVAGARSEELPVARDRVKALRERLGF